MGVKKYNSVVRIIHLEHLCLLGIILFSFSTCANNLITENETNIKSPLIFDVKNYGATGDGISDDTQGINKAIKACSESEGGVVLLTSGTYLSGSIHLMSNITIELNLGATIKSKTEGFDLWEDNPFDEGVMDKAYYHIQASMFWGEKLTNLKITGKGSIDACGLTKSSNVKAGVGDKVIALKNCNNIEISNLSFVHSGTGGAHYVILLTGCDSVIINNLNIKAQRDGIDLMNSSNTQITNTTINSIRYEGSTEKGGDDAIKIGSDYSLGEIRPSYNISVRNCTISAGCNGIMLGTETLGPIRDCTFEDIEINFAGKNGIGITSNDGSIINGLKYKNIKMKNVLAPFFIKISDVKRIPSGMTYSTGRITNIVFENISATDIINPINGEMTNVIWGKANSFIENIEFRNVLITAKGGKSLSNAKTEPPENDERFPQKLIEDVLNGPLPAYGYYVRNLKEIKFYNCYTGFEKNDYRPSFMFDNGEDVLLSEVNIQKGSGAECCIEVRNTVKDFKINSCTGLPEINETVTNKKF